MKSLYFSKRYDFKITYFQNVVLSKNVLFAKKRKNKNYNFSNYVFFPKNVKIKNTHFFKNTYFFQKNVKIKITTFQNYALFPNYVLFQNFVFSNLRIFSKITTFQKKRNLKNVFYGYKKDRTFHFF